AELGYRLRHVEVDRLRMRQHRTVIRRGFRPGNEPCHGLLRPDRAGELHGGTPAGERLRHAFVARLHRLAFGKQARAVLIGIAQRLDERLGTDGRGKREARRSETEREPAEHAHPRWAIASTYDTPEERSISTDGCSAAPTASQARVAFAPVLRRSGGGCTSAAKLLPGALAAREEGSCRDRRRAARGDCAAGTGSTTPTIPG